VSKRYEVMFEKLRARKEGAFVPFVVLGDPDLETSGRILRTLAQAGADAVELGIAYSDPVADGPTIQKADARALKAGVRPRDAWGLIRGLRQAFPELPIGLLVYANLVEAPGPKAFYSAAAEAGVDSVVVGDVPTYEAAPYCELARSSGIAPVLMAPETCTEEHLSQIARLGSGYTYVVTRSGVTGAETAALAERHELLEKFAKLGAPPPVFGFGISRPEHVREALTAGAAGAISGSAVVARVEQNLGNVPAMLESLRGFVTEMKAATRSR